MVIWANEDNGTYWHEVFERLNCLSVRFVAAVEWWLDIIWGGELAADVHEERISMRRFRSSFPFSLPLVLAMIVQTRNDWMELSRFNWWTRTRILWKSNEWWVGHCLEREWTELWRTIDDEYLSVEWRRNLVKELFTGRALSPRTIFGIRRIVQGDVYSPHWLCHCPRFWAK